MRDIAIQIAYIVSAGIFIMGIKMLGSATTARRGNRLSAIGMLLAVIITLFDQGIVSAGIQGYAWIAGGIALGALIGGILAKRVQMTGMPEMVALLNGFGGLASLLVAWAEYATLPALGLIPVSGEMRFTLVVSALTVIVGGITFTGSLVAYLKLSGKMSGRPFLFAGQKAINFVVMLVLAAATVALALALKDYSATAFYTLIGGAFLLGVLGVIPIGGGDMPVVISLLNSLSGVAASFAGFIIGNTVLIVAGCLVGASGLILTVIMCKAMNRTIGNVLFGGFGAAASGSGGAAEQGEMKAVSTEDAYYILEAARSVVVIPGYGMAVAQAQHVVKELGELLENNGAEIRYAIHPVAGRMPGHMNVLLAEADVPYEQLVEMDNINPIMPTVDVAIVIGANDVVNPAAATDPSSPIYGMPIINAHEAKTVFALKRGKGTGFSGLENKLFFMPNTRMIYGDAKATVADLVSQMKG
ncbi:NAD(P) transhydrogenase subunit beta [Ereboglobus sp. PH5-10]|uniref:NAD(P)(+) transhydrogenase (Re/Si-specific) subunit beta n=1 Tax=Ereboglobus sp. PH5-10 TaxID=2940629 RepID=UPI0024050C71|nr:NAD(P)(+) transhydrogenase (Re/Si-specific) subunit beta [Ereboglobus sp. PH5-10]MDF9826408.1 NAD(P) transhydrogenase subunit beta [Ereboglobus sp. PH5-10]